MKRILCLILFVAILLLTGCDVQKIVEDMSWNSSVIAEPDYSSYPQVSNIKELRDYVFGQQQQDNLKFSFVYNGEEPLPEGIFHHFSEACFINYTQEGEGPYLFEVELFEYPGNKIVDAYFSGDTAALTDQEKKALEIAVEMVELAKTQAENDYELELLLYRALTEKITYYSGDMTYDKPEDQPWFLNAVGALTMGAANCQGYADAFYTVASIAGFQVGRMGVDTPEDPHCVNTICLNGQWYVVDVTYGDNEDGYFDYYLFNAGMDVIGSYWWDEEIALYPIAQTTNPEYYYYFRNQIAFETPEDAAQYVAETWDATGQDTVHAMVHNFTDADYFSDYLYEVLVEMDKYFRFSVWYSDNERDIFLVVVFEPVEG